MKILMYLDQDFVGNTLTVEGRDSVVIRVSVSDLISALKQKVAILMKNSILMVPLNAEKMKNVEDTGFV